MTFSFHPSALVEFEEAANDHACCQPAMAQAFGQALEAAVHRVMAEEMVGRALGHPSRATRAEEGIQQTSLPIFSHSLIYRVIDDHVRFVAVLNHGRAKSLSAPSDAPAS